MVVELGEVWEMYSAGAGSGYVVVTKIEDSEVTLLRYEGVLKLITVYVTCRTRNWFRPI